MRMKTLTLSTLLVLSFSGAAFAQTAAGGGSAEGNVNNPGSVKSNSEKSMERSTGSAVGGTADTTGSTLAPGAAGRSTMDDAAAPSSGHSSGGGTSTGGMTR